MSSLQQSQQSSRSNHGKHKTNAQVANPKLSENQQQQQSKQNRAEANAQPKQNNTSVKSQKQHVGKQSSANQSQQRSYTYIRKIVEQSQEYQQQQQQDQLEDLQKKQRIEEEFATEQLRRQIQLELEEQMRCETMIAVAKKAAEAAAEVQETLDELMDDLIYATEARAYLQTSDGLRYLLESNFIDFADQLGNGTTAEILEFNGRNYTPIDTNSSSHKRTSNNNGNKHNNQFNNKHQQPHSNQFLQQSYSQNNNNNNTNAYNKSKTHNNNKRNTQQGAVQKQQQQNQQQTVQQQQQNYSQPSQDDWRGGNVSGKGMFVLGKDELKFLLNVLTPENFDKLKEQFFVLCCADVDKCIRHLVNKVCKEAKYAKLYCQLAVYVKTREEQVEAAQQSNPSANSKKSSKASQNGTNSDGTATVGPANLFRTKMLDSLSGFFYDEQQLLEVLGSNNNNNSSSGSKVGDANEINNDESSSNISMEEILQKKRFQNFLRFLGELFMARFMPKKVISYCVQTMLQQFVAGGLQADDKHIEGIIALMDAIGADFEIAWKNGGNSSRQNSTDLALLQEIRKELLRSSTVAAKKGIAHSKSAVEEEDNDDDDDDDSEGKFDNRLFESEFISFNGVMNVLVFLAASPRISIRIKSLITNLLHRWHNRWQQALHQMETPKTVQELQDEHFNLTNNNNTNNYNTHLQQQYNNYEKSKKLADNFNNNNSNTATLKYVQKTSNSSNNIMNANGVGKTNSNTAATSSVDVKSEARRILKEIDVVAAGSVEFDESVAQVKAIGADKMIVAILCEFFNARLELVRGKRIGFVSAVLRESIVHASKKGVNGLAAKAVVSGFNEALNAMCSQACDFPNIIESFVAVICPLVMHGDIEVKELVARLTGEDEDTDNDRKQFFNEVHNECYNYLRAKNQFI